MEKESLRHSHSLQLLVILLLSLRIEIGNAIADHTGRLLEVIVALDILLCKVGYKRQMRSLIEAAGGHHQLLTLVQTGYLVVHEVEVVHRNK